LTQDINIIGKSTIIKDIFSIIEKIKNSDVSVIIFGESGTGKELLARYIHYSSLRKNKNFVAINCASIPEGLLENELFGHKKGAFTDAHDDYIGKFGYADQGTVFLDEISELSLSLQSKLLRVIQFKEYEQIGSSETRKIDVRIIAATNTNFTKLLKEKKFREDLYYRLNVIPITLPPLRERKEDIELLADYYLKIFSDKSKKNIKSFAKEVKEIFLKYNWPGNIRQLQNVIERAVILCNKEIIGLIDIDLFDDYDNAGKNDLNLKDAINNFKKHYIIEILENNNWNQSKTAKILKIQRTYLSRLINELKIDKI
jgi:Nif-specific regulatory protein